MYKAYFYFLTFNIGLAATIIEQCCLCRLIVLMSRGISPHLVVDVLTLQTKVWCEYSTCSPCCRRHSDLQVYVVESTVLASHVVIDILTLRSLHSPTCSDQRWSALSQFWSAPISAELNFPQPNSRKRTQFCQLSADQRWVMHSALISTEQCWLTENPLSTDQHWSEQFSTERITLYINKSHNHISKINCDQQELNPWPHQ